jgi:hypothetical protein
LDGDLDPSDRRVGACYAGDPRWANYSPFGIGVANTLRSWLSMWSLECSSCRGAPHLARIDVPSLVIQSKADTGVFPSDAETIFEHLAAKEKRLEFMDWCVAGRYGWFYFPVCNTPQRRMGWCSGKR